MSDSHKMLDAFLHQGVRPGKSFGRKGVAEAVAGFKVGGDGSTGGGSADAGFTLPDDDQARLMVPA